MKKTDTNPVIKKTKRNLRCIFTDAELLQIGKNLAEKTNDLGRLQEDKKRVVSDFAAKVSAAEAEISILTNNITSGYEYRNVPCSMHMDTPEPGKKEVSRDDTGALLGFEEMTQEEMQIELIPAET